MNFIDAEDFQKRGCSVCGTRGMEKSVGEIGRLHPVFSALNHPAKLDQP
jgi:hypothetical protein